MEALLKAAAWQNSDVMRAKAIYRDTRSEIGKMQLNCPAHGAFMSDGFSFIRPLPPTGKRETWTPCPSCLEAENELRERKAEESRAREEAYQIAVRIAAAGVPQRFTDKTLNDYKAENEGQRRVLGVAREYVDRFAMHRERGDSLVFAGMPGTGKSLLSMLVLQEVCMKGYGARYTTCQGLIQSIRKTWGKEGEGRESDVIDDLVCTSLLVLDECGVQAGTDNEKALLFDVLDGRYAEMRPTIFATNLDKSNFQDFVGDRIWDRLTETARWVPFVGESYRPRARREMAEA
jgi:DNA replication protein DnaC